MPYDTITYDVDGAIARAQETHGAPRIVVSCAGVGTPQKTIGRDGPIDMKHFQQVIQINLIGTMRVMSRAAWAMAQGQPLDADGCRGVVVNTASVAAFDGQIGQAAYASSKGGVAALTLPAARDLARNGIRVVTIAPGIFETPMMAGMTDEVRASLEQQVPHPSRLGHPAEYAALVRSIIGNPMLNGEVIRLDGAIRMQPK